MITVDTLEAKKNQIQWDRENMLEWFRVECTYTSNAIEGSTFTRHETSVLLEKHITIGGKTIREHVEVVNHANAFDEVVALSQALTIPAITEEHILSLHAQVLHGITACAGVYRDVPVRVVGTPVVFPNWRKVPELMQGLIERIHHAKVHPIDIAFDTHFQLVSIHPFMDGNGRTARLLLNLILMIAGFPPFIVRAEDRLLYIQSIEKGQLTGDLQDYQTFIYQALDNVLELCLQT